GQVEDKAKQRPDGELFQQLRRGEVPLIWGSGRRTVRSIHGSSLLSGLESHCPHDPDVPGRWLLASSPRPNSVAAVTTALMTKISKTYCSALTTMTSNNRRSMPTTANSHSRWTPAKKHPRPSKRRALSLAAITVSSPERRI